MNIAAEVNRMTVPQEFSRFCKSLLIAKHGDDFLAIDDDSADKGNDGYLKSENRIFAFHCFKRVQNQSLNRDIYKKMHSDLQKAVMLRNEGWRVTAWTFISNYPIPEAVAEKIHTEAKQSEIDASWRDHEHLSLMLREYSFVLKDFPALDPAQNEEVLRSIMDDMESIKSLVGVTSKPKDPGLESDDEYQRVMEIAKMRRTPKLITELKGVIYQAKNSVASIQAVVVLDHWFDSEADLTTDLADFASHGIGQASTIGRPDSMAMMYAIKGKYESLQLASILYKAIPLASSLNESEFRQVSRQIGSLQEQFERNFQKSVSCLKIDADLETTGHAMSHIMRGFLALADAQKNLEPDSDDWRESYRRARKFAMGSREAFMGANDQDEHVESLFNLGVCLEFGEEIEAAKAIYAEIDTIPDKPSLIRVKKASQEKFNGLTQ